MALRAPCARVAWRRRDVRRATRRVSSASGDVGTAVSVRRMRPDDLPAVIEILADASDPAKVSAAALASYAREAVVASPRDELALVAETSEGPLEPREVVGVVGVLLEDRLKPPEMRLGGENIAYVLNLAVAERARRKGVGKALLRAAERAAARAGFDEVACRVDGDNSVARGMYDRGGYRPVEPKKLVAFRKLMATLYGFAGVAHAADLLVGPSALPAMAGAPAWAAMDPAQRLAAATWCALGPAAAAAERSGPPAVAVAGLVAYGVFEVALAAACAAAFGAVGGDAATSAVAVQAVVFACYRVLAPGPRRGRVNLGKSLADVDVDDDDDAAEERFVALFLGFRERSTPLSASASLSSSSSRERRVGSRHGRDGSRAAASGRDDVDAAESTGWRTLGVGASADDPRMEDGWVALEPEPEPSFDAAEDYERDDSGRVVYAPRGFFYDGVRPSDGGERFKVDVGIVGARRRRTFALRKRLFREKGEECSDLVEVTMERPLGITFEPDTEGRVRVSDFVRGSRAGRADAVARLQAPASVGASAPRRGDILRAFTTSTLSYGPRAQLLGDLSGTKRAVVLFGADDQPWGKTISALKSGLVADGPVTLILERDRDEARASAWTPEEARASPVGDTGNAGETARERVEEIGGERRRVRGDAWGGGGVPDPVNASFVVAALAFALLIFTGFNP